MAEAEEEEKKKRLLSMLADAAVIQEVGMKKKRYSVAADCNSPRYMWDTMIYCRVQ